MAPSTLSEMCTRIAIQNLPLLPSLAGLPMKAVWKILCSVRSPKLLRAFELADEELADITGPFWQRFITIDFHQLSKRFNWMPAKPRDWYRIYEKYEQYQEDRQNVAVELLKQRMEADKQKTASQTTGLISFRDAKRTMPEAVNSAFGRGGGGGGGRFGGSSSRKPATPQAMSWARREARQSAMRLRGPRGAAPVTTKLTEAPQAMVKQKLIEKQFDPEAAINGAVQIRPPRRRPAAAAMTQEQLEREKERKEREQRLLGIMKGGASAVARNGHNTNDASKKAPAAATLLTFSDGEDEPNRSGGVLDDLFGDLDEDDGNDKDAPSPAARDPTPASSAPKKSSTSGNSSSNSSNTPARPALRASPAVSRRNSSGRLFSNKFSPFKGASIVQNVSVPKKPATAIAAATSPPPAKTAAGPRPSQHGSMAGSPPAPSIPNATTSGPLAPRKRKAPNIFMTPTKMARR